MNVDLEPPHVYAGGKTRMKPQLLKMCISRSPNDKILEIEKLELIVS